MTDARKNAVLSASFIVLAVLQASAYAAIAEVRRRFADHTYPFDASPAVLTIGLAFLTVTIATFAAIWFQRRTIERSGRRLYLPLALAAMAIFAVSIARPPEGSADLYWNTLMARGWVLHGQNPYLTTPQDLSFDPVFPLTIEGWRGFPMVYGPLWTLFSALPVLLSPDPATEFIVTRTLLAAVYAAAGLLLFRTIRAKAEGPANVLLAVWFLNPVASFEIANAGQTDGLLVLPLAVAAAGLIARKPIMAVPGLVAAALVKLWPVALLPILGGIRGAGRRPWLIGGGMAAAMAVAATTPFGWSWRSVQALMDIHGLNGAGGTDPWQLVADAAFVLIALWLCREARAGRTTPEAALAAGAFAFYAVVLNWVFPRYLAAAVPLFLSSTRDSRLMIAIAGAVAVISFSSYALVMDVLQLSCPLFAVLMYFSPRLDAAAQKKSDAGSL